MDIFFLFKKNSILFARSTQDSVLNVKPFEPFLTKSNEDPTISEQIIALLDAIASLITNPQGSNREGRINTSDFW